MRAGVRIYSISGDLVGDDAHIVPSFGKELCIVSLAGARFSGQPAADSFM